MADKQSTYRLTKADTALWLDPSSRRPLFEQLLRQTRILTNGVDSYEVLVLDSDGKELDRFPVEPWTLQPPAVP